MWKIPLLQHAKIVARAELTDETQNIFRDSTWIELTEVWYEFFYCVTKILVYQRCCVAHGTR